MVDDLCPVLTGHCLLHDTTPQIAGRAPTNRLRSDQKSLRVTKMLPRAVRELGYDISSSSS